MNRVKWAAIWTTWLYWNYCSFAYIFIFIFWLLFCILDFYRWSFFRRFHIPNIINEIHLLITISQCFVWGLNVLICIISERFVAETLQIAFKYSFFVATVLQQISTTGRPNDESWFDSIINDEDSFIAPMAFYLKANDCMKIPSKSLNRLGLGEFINIIRHRRWVTSKF